MSVCLSRGLSWQLALALLLLFPIFSSAHIRKPLHPNDEYVTELWETEEGLPENSVTSILQAPNGYLWLGTFNGVVRFDGIKFTVFDRSNTPELPSGAILALFFDSKGRLWVSTDHGPALLEEGIWRSFREEDGWTPGVIKCFSENLDGSIVMLLQDRTLRRYDGTRFESIPTPPAPSRVNVLAFVDPQGQLWGVGGNFIGYYIHNQWQELPYFTEQTNAVVRGAAPSRNRDSLWILDEKRLLRFNAQALVEERPITERIINCWSMYEDSKGNVWISSYTSGLLRVSPDGTSKRISTDNGLADDSLRCTFEDQEGNIWVGTSGGGLHRLKPKRFHTVDEEHGLPERNIKAIAEEKPGRMLVGTQGGGLARVVDGQGIRWIKRLIPGSGSYVWSILIDKQTNLWVGTYDNGLFRFNDDSPVQIPFESIGGKSIYALFQDSKERIWIGTDNGVALFEGGQFKIFQSDSGMTAKSIRCFAEDTRTGKIWVGTYDGGLFSWEDGRFTSHRRQQNWHIDQVWSLYVDKEGVLWMGTSDSGLIRYKNGAFFNITEAHGLPTRHIGAILEDDAGHFWMGSNRGILHVPLQQLNAVADGIKQSIRCMAYGIADGLHSIECATGYQSTGIRDSQGRLWFATLKGVTSIQPGEVKANTNVPPVIIENIVVDGKPAREFRPVCGKQDDITVTLPPGSRRVEIHYTALSLTSPEKTRFTYFIDGDRNREVEAGPRRVTYLEDLHPGSYRFKVQATTSDGITNERGAVISMVVLPFFWQTWWFKSSAAFGLIGLVSTWTWRTAHNRLRHAQRRLEEQQAIDHIRAQLAATLENTSDYVGFTDAQGNTSYLNLAARQLLGLTPDEDVQGRPMRDWHPACAYRIISEEALPAALATGHWSGESALKHRDGHEILVSQVIVAHKKKDGSLDFFSTVARDITERKKAEIALKESQANLYALVENTTDAIWSVDRDYRLITSNSHFQSLLFNTNGKRFYPGASADELASTPQAAAVWKGWYDRAFAGEHFSLEFTNTIRGATVHFEASFNPIITAGKVTGVSVYCTDITARKRSQIETLRLAAAVEQSADGILILSPGGMIEFANSTFERMSGFHRQEIVGWSFEWLREAQGLKLPFLNLVKEIQSNSVASGRNLCRRKDGTIYPEEFSFAAVRDDQGKTANYVGVLRDVSKEAALEEQVRHSQKMEAIGVLAGGVAHDFNNILTVIQGYASLLQGNQPMTDHQRNCIQQIARAADRASNLTKQLLTFSRRQVLQPRNLDLNEIVSSMSQMLTRILREDIQLVWKLTSDLPSVHADPGMIEQVLMNLIVNSRDALLKGGSITISTQARVLDVESARQHPEAYAGQFATLTVTDTGCGIPAEFLNRIFEPFFTTKDVGRGTGLGLPTVYGIVKQHRGWVTVSSKVGEGTTIEIFLPASTQLEPADTDTAAPEIAKSGSESILVVEDETAVRELVSSALQSKGYRVVEAKSGIEALEVWKKFNRKFDLLLTDLVMPGGLNGKELAELLQAEKPGIKVIYTSGYSADLVEKDLNIVPGVNFLPKPYQVGELIQIVRDCLDRDPASGNAKRA